MDHFWESVPTDSASGSLAAAGVTILKARLLPLPPALTRQAPSAGPGVLHCAQTRRSICFWARKIPLCEKCTTVFQAVL